MDEQAKPMALQHIEDGEYKQAFAILDDFKADIDAERLLNRQKQSTTSGSGCNMRLYRKKEYDKTP